MASLNSVQTRQILSRNTVIQVLANDASVMIRLKALAAAGAVTSVTVTTATNIVIITANGGTDTYAFATYTTIGAVVDAINADGMFEAKVLDALRSGASASTIVTGANTITSSGYYDLMVDTTAALFVAARLTYDRNTGVNSKLSQGHRVTIKEIVTSLTLGGGADVNAFSIYECTPSSRGNVETLILQRTPVTGSVSTLNWASGVGGITAGEGNDLVVVITDGTSFATSDYLTVSGLIE